MSVRDHFKDLTKTGATEEDRAAGQMALDLLNREVHPEGQMSRFELYVIPYDKEALFSKHAKYAAAEKIRDTAWRAYENENPQKENEKESEWLLRGVSFVDAKCPKEDKIMHDVRLSVFMDKDKLFDELAGDLNELMHTLRSEVSLNVVSKNLDIASDIVLEHSYHGMEKEVIELDKRLSGLREEHRKSPGDASVSKSLDGLKHDFFARVGRPILEDSYKSSKSPFLVEIFGGKFNSTYFSGHDEFFELFDEHRKNGYDISLDITGALEGKYELLRYPKMKFPELGGGDHEGIFEPIALRMDVPKEYSGIVEKALGKMREKYGDKVVPLENLKEAK